MTESIRPGVDWRWQVRNLHRDLPLGHPATEGAIGFIAKVGEMLGADESALRDSLRLAKQIQTVVLEHLAEQIKSQGRESVAEQIETGAKEFVLAYGPRTGNSEEILPSFINRAITSLLSQIPESKKSADSVPSVNSRVDKGINIGKMLDRLGDMFFPGSLQPVTTEGVALPIPLGNLPISRIDFKVPSLVKDDPIIAFSAALIGSGALGAFTLKTNINTFVNNWGGDPGQGTLFSVGVSAIETLSFIELERAITETRRDNKITLNEWLGILGWGSIFLSSLGFDFAATYLGLTVSNDAAKMFCTGLISLGFEYCLSRLPGTFIIMLDALQTGKYLQHDTRYNSNT